MATYVSLLKFTGQGAKAIKKTATRAGQFRAAAEKSGVHVVSQFWTLGDFDGVLVIESDRAEKALHCLAELASAGNVTTHTLPAYSADEIKVIMKDR